MLALSYSVRVEDWDCFATEKSGVKSGYIMNGTIVESELIVISSQSFDILLVPESLGNVESDSALYVFENSGLDILILEINIIFEV